jgi:hypothetical protein
MPQIIAVLFEDNKEDSYVAIKLDGTEPEIIFTKGPSFTNIMGPYPKPYAEATFKRWHYLKVLNPPEVSLHPDSLKHATLLLTKCDENNAEYCPDAV